MKLLNGRASRAEVYPDELCFRILKGLMETMKKDGRIHANGIGAVMAEEESEIWEWKRHGTMLQVKSWSLTE